MIDNLILKRGGDPDASAAMFSLPLPRGAVDRIMPAFAAVGMQPLAWWQREKQPRRMLTVLSAAAGQELPETLGLESGEPRSVGSASPWTLSTPLTTERLPYVAHEFTDIDSLRGVPAADCTTLEYALDLTYGGRTLRLQPGATGPGTAECLWQNVQIDRLWRNAAAEAVRVGGIIYNEDTYLWADLYLILFANGVVSATLHFTNGKLHIKGYDFRGLPYLKIAGGNAAVGTDDTEVVPPSVNPDCLLEGRAPSRPMRPECRERPEGLKCGDVEMPRDGWRHDLGLAQFNFADTAITCGPEAPATLRTREGAVYYTPFDRVSNSRKPDAPVDLWEPGFARTVRFQFSLSDAVPAVGRYVIPGWWYGVCGEPWPGGLLPVCGRFTPVAESVAERVQTGMARGGFEGGSVASLGGAGNDGGAGAGLMQQAYLTGDSAQHRDALDYCTYWADLAVDHTDFSVHQWLGGWGWKTCAYTKFRDIVFAWLETGDPWMRDTLEMTAETYWAWFRSNWPRNTIGRDAFELGGWVLLWRYFHSDHAGERMRELVRMIGAVVEGRGAIGGQMGAGPHPGWHASLYMTGVVMVGLVEAMEAEAEVGADTAPLLASLEILHRHFVRDDVELFPVSLGSSSRANWGVHNDRVWSVFAMHIYSALGRRLGFTHTMVREGFSKMLPDATTRWEGRAGDNHVHPRVHDAFMLAARIAADGRGVDLTPAFGPATMPWPDLQTIATPWGPLEIAARETPEAVFLTFAAPADFRVRITTAGETSETRSCGEKRLVRGVTGPVASGG